MARRRVAAKGRGDLGQKARSVEVTTESAFWRTIRTQLADKPFRNPYIQHPWSYAGIQAIVNPLARAPFRIYKTTRGAAERTYEQRRDLLKKTVKTLRPELLDALSAITSTRQRLRALRMAHPELNPYQLARAVGDATVVESGPFYELFRRPNPLVTRFQLWEVTFAGLLTWGSVFWLLDKANGKPCGANEFPQTIWPVPGTAVKPKASGGRLVGWKIDWEHGEFKIKEDNRPPEAVVRWYLANPEHPLLSLSPFDPLRGELEGDYYAQRFNVAYFKNGATPSGIIYSKKKLTPSQQRELLESWEDRHQAKNAAGTDRFHRPDIMHGGELEFQETRTRHRDMEFHQMRVFERDAVLAGLRVSKSNIGITEDVNRSNALEQERRLWETNLVPRIIYAEDLLDGELFSAERSGGSDLWGAFDLSSVEALRDSLGDKVAAAFQLWQMCVPFNDINTHMELGFDPYPWGDTGYRASSLTPVNEKEEKEDPPPQLQPDGGDGGDGDGGDGGDDGDGEDDDTKKTDDSDEEPDKEEEPDDEEKGLRAAPALILPPQLKDLAWEAINEELYFPAEARFVSKIGVFLHDLRKKQLELASGYSEGDAVESVLFPVNEWKERFVSKTLPVFNRVAERTWEFTNNEIDLLTGAKALRTREVWADVEDDVLSVMSDMAGASSVSVNTLYTNLADGFAVAVANGGGSEELMAFTRQLFNKVRNGRLQLMGNMASGDAISWTREYLFGKRGVSKVEWATAEDERVRDTHVTYGGAGAQPKGTNWATLSGGLYILERPHDPRAPKEETMNCRCVLLAREVAPAAAA